ncbi:hypothetical protein C8Q78DRAFT_1023113 [Trametes maxima]|nr:hypothetical protein C8Q78DRAFT_1023113 [Trametes maxima]
MTRRRGPGTRVAVYGSIRPPTATYAPLTVSAYSVLGSNQPPSPPFTAPNFTIPKNNVRFFQSDDMPYGSYVLAINVTVASIDSPYFLDYIAVEAPGPKPTPTPTSSVLASSAGSSTSLPTRLGSVSGTGPPLGAVVGAAMGGVALIAAILLLAAYAYKRRHHRLGYPPQFDYDPVGQRDPPNLVTPFIMSEPHDNDMRQPYDVGSASSSSPPPPPLPFASSLQTDTTLWNQSQLDSKDGIHSLPRVGRSRAEHSVSSPLSGVVFASPSNHIRPHHEGNEESPPAYTLS